MKAPKIRRLRRAREARPGTLGHPRGVASPQMRRRVVARRVRAERREAESQASDTAPITIGAGLTHIAPLEEGDDQERPLDFGLIRRLFGYMKPHRQLRNRLLCYVLIRSLQLPALTVLLGHLINGPVAHHDARGTWIGAGEFLLLGLITQFILHYRQRLSLEIGEVVVHDLRRDIFAHLQTMTLSYFHRTPVGKIISRMTSDIETIRSLIQDVAFVSLVGLGQIVFTAAFMCWYDHVLFLMVLAMAPVLLALNHYFRKALSKAMRSVQESFSRVTATLAESISGIRVTQGFVRQDVNSRMFLNLVVDHAENTMLTVRRSGALSPLLDLNNQLFMAGLLMVGSYRILHTGGNIAIMHLRADALVAYYVMSATFFEPIMTMGTVYNQALTAMAGAERVFKLLDTVPEHSDLPDVIPMRRIAGHVEFRHLSFGYVPRHLVLKDIHFKVMPGETVALVGHTGSGKSSLIHLLSKFYLPTNGQLLIDGQDIRDIQSDSLHRQMGIVEQINFLFSGTVMENIRIGRSDATDEEVIDATRRLNVLDMIESLPEGFQTQVGERGESISLGQRQIVCFARALLTDPRIMVLDEATSSVDTLTEGRLQEALGKLLANRTSFVVAHRLSTIRNANQVIVLDRGRIVERGTHHQLLRAGGVYANLYRQFIRTAAG